VPRRQSRPWGTDAGPPSSSQHTRMQAPKEATPGIWKLLHGTPTLVDEAEETRKIEGQKKGSHGVPPSQGHPPSCLLKPQIALLGHGGGKIHGSRSSAAQAAAPGPPAGELPPHTLPPRRGHQLTRRPSPVSCAGTEYRRRGPQKKTERIEQLQREL